MRRRKAGKGMRKGKSREMVFVWKGGTGGSNKREGKGTEKWKVGGEEWQVVKCWNRFGREEEEQVGRRRPDGEKREKREVRVRG